MYGMTDEPQRSDRDQREEHRRAQPIDARAPAILRDAVAEDDVEHEERGIGEGEDESQRLTAEAHARQQRAAAHRQRQRQRVAAGTGAQSRQRDLPQELDGPHRTQRQARNRQIEAGVHQPQRGA
jgi:hypothetical protein